MVGRLMRIATLGVLAMVLAALMGVGGCYLVVRTEITHPDVYAFRGQRIVPEEWYRDLFDAMSQCSGKVKSFDDLTFIQVPAGAMGNWVGLFSPLHRIFLDERHVMDRRIVGHEMLHYLTDQGHDDPRFDPTVERCLPETLL